MTENQWLSGANSMIRMEAAKSNIPCVLQGASLGRPWSAYHVSGKDGGLQNARLVDRLSASSYCSQNQVIKTGPASPGCPCQGGLSSRVPGPTPTTHCDTIAHPQPVLSFLLSGTKCWH
jgi:hypothetical protein